MRINCYSPWSRGKLFQFLAVTTATLTAVSDGIAYGWTAPILPILRNVTTTPIQINVVDEQWFEYIYLIGGVVAFPLTVYCVDNIGRKKTILLASLLQIIAWIFIALTKSVIPIYIARFLAGVAGDLGFVAGPMYIAEIADQEIRGFLGSIAYLMMITGILIVYIIAPLTSIMISSIVAASIAILQLATFPFMPESPYFLLLKGKQTEALKSLQRLRSNKHCQSELEEISKAVERQNSERGNLKDLFVVPSNRKALIILLTLNAAQHLGSISVMMMNLHTILLDAATMLPASTAGIVFSAVMLVAASSSSLVADRLGRKALIISSSLLSGASLLALAIYFAVKNNGVDITSCSWIPVVAVMVYAAVFKYGLGLMPIVMTAELFPTSVKAMGMTISDISYFAFGILSVFLYQQLEQNFGMHWPFFVFAISCVFTATFTILYIPETKRRTLEEIQFILKGQPIPDRSSGKEIRMGY